MGSYLSDLFAQVPYTALETIVSIEGGVGVLGAVLVVFIGRTRVNSLSAILDRVRERRLFFVVAGLALLLWSLVRAGWVVKEAEIARLNEAHAKELAALPTQAQLDDAGLRFDDEKERADKAEDELGEAQLEVADLKSRLLVANAQLDTQRAMTEGIRSDLEQSRHEARESSLCRSLRESIVVGNRILDRMEAVGQTQIVAINNYGPEIGGSEILEWREGVRTALEVQNRRWAREFTDFLASVKAKNHYEVFKAEVEYVGRLQVRSDCAS